MYYNRLMFRLDTFMGKRVLKSSLIDDDNIVAFFTTRDLSLKAGERDDLIPEVENNKKLVCEGLNIPFENLVIPQQTHSDNVEIIYLKVRSASASHLTLENTDALVTNEPNIALALNFADCVPILFYDPIEKVIAAAHAGWRGTVAKIGPKTVDKMVKNFNSNPEDIIALIGPAIGKCCFEAGEDVLAQLKQSVNGNFSVAFSDFNADLKLINKLQLLDSGVKKIDVSEYCTSCQNELFFSYRKENGKTARHSAVILLKG